MFKCRGHLGECTIRLGYAPFLTTIVFKRVDSAWGPTSDIRAEVMGFRTQGCCWGEDCWQIEGLAVSINSSIFECHGRLGECTIRLGYAPFQTTIAFRRVDIAWGRTKSFMASVSFSFELRWSSLRGRPAYSRKDGEV